MTRAQVSILQCDGDDAFCAAWVVDHYETGASAADGVRLTETTRHPGWVSRGDEDYCPEHAQEVTACRPTGS